VRAPLGLLGLLTACSWWSPDPTDKDAVDPDDTEPVIVDDTEVEPTPDTDSEPPVDTEVEDPPDTDLIPPRPWDADADGFTEDVDCDDRRPSVNPEATEICNGRDDNCNGLSDDDDPTLDIETTVELFPDADADGYGVTAQGTQACAEREGFVAIGGDCDDTLPEVSPGRPEQCNDRDDDCDDGTTEHGRASFESDQALWTSLTATLTPAVGVANWTAPGPGTLHLCSGVWRVAVQAGDDLTIEGHGTPDTVLLDGLSGTRSLTLHDGDFQIRHVTLRNGEADEGGATLCTDGTLTAQDVVWTNNLSRGHGGALALERCDATLSEVVFRSNASELDGGAISAEQSAVSGATIELDSHSARWGGAVHLQGGSLQLTDLLALDHQAALGGLIHAAGASVTLTGALLLDNTATGDGGALWVDGEVSLTDVAAFGHHADGAGGVIAWRGGALDLIAVELRGNTSDGPGGAIAALAPVDDVTLTDTILAEHSAGEGAGALHAPDAAEVHLTRTEVSLNAGEVGGLWLGGDVHLTAGSLVDNTGEEVGGLRLSGGSLTVSQFEIARNLGGLTGGLELNGPSAVDIDEVDLLQNEGGVHGGALSLTGGQLTLSRAQVHSNLAPDGGGLWLSGVTATLSDTTLYENVADSDGGGVRASDCALTTTALDAQRNVAGADGGAYYLDGGSTLSTVGGLLISNRADRGGGIWLESSEATLQEVEISLQQATRGAGAFLTDAELTLTDCPATLQNAGDGSLATLAGDSSWRCFGDLTTPWVGGNLTTDLTGLRAALLVLDPGGRVLLDGCDRGRFVEGTVNQNVDVGYLPDGRTWSSEAADRWACLFLVGTWDCAP
jgi:predicted outer membrane repeat protein